MSVKGSQMFWNGAKWWSIEIPPSAAESLSEFKAIVLNRIKNLFLFLSLDFVMLFFLSFVIIDDQFQQRSIED